MSHHGCNAMELECLERAKTDIKNRGKWIAQAERWHELTRAEFMAIAEKTGSTGNARWRDGNAASAELALHSL
jgi:hypothetical protein